MEKNRGDWQKLKRPLIRESFDNGSMTNLKVFPSVLADSVPADSVRRLCPDPSLSTSQAPRPQVVG
eukprot:scaffold1830_cov246-Pinguiococcus_pyrenoidosus.AAC.1